MNKMNNKNKLLHKSLFLVSQKSPRFSVDKKGKTMEIIVALVSALIVFFIILAFTSPQIFNLSRNIANQQDPLFSDPDGDEIKGISDKCPCTKGDIENDGCPGGFSEEQIKEDKQKFNKNKECR